MNFRFCTPHIFADNYVGFLIALNCALDPNETANAIRHYSAILLQLMSIKPSPFTIKIDASLHTQHVSIEFTAHPAPRASSATFAVNPAPPHQQFN